jgi:hypothetical protein
MTLPEERLMTGEIESVGHTNSSSFKDRVAAGSSATGCGLAARWASHHAGERML